MVSIPTIPLNATADDYVFIVFDAVPFLAPAILFFLGVVLIMVGYSFEERRTGNARIQPWIAGVSLMVSIAMIILYLYPGIVDGTSLIISIAITAASILWFFLSSE